MFKELMLYMIPHKGCCATPAYLLIFKVEFYVRRHCMRCSYITYLSVNIHRY